jgi:hypothetical protein
MITEYEYQGPGDDWRFRRTRFDRINLLVGASGAGKTRFLNTLFNFASTISKGTPFRSGSWYVGMTLGEYSYEYEYEGRDGKEAAITSETVRRWKTDHHEEVETLIQRESGSFAFRDTPLPKFAREIPSLHLLKEEPDVMPLHMLFARMQRRKFFETALQDAVTIQNLPKRLVNELAANPQLEPLWLGEHALSAKLFLMKQFFPEKYKIAGDSLRQVFPTIEEYDVQMLGETRLPNVPVRGVEGDMPVFVVKERGVSQWLPLPVLSSGMQKVLLIATDIVTLPSGTTYLIDEYENSLGINAIDFLPQFLIEHGGNKQFFITTHHPYLINSMPMRAWRVFHRKGQTVSIKLGEELEERFGKSKQKAFIQLINDPFYSEGIE